MYFKNKNGETDVCHGIPCYTKKAWKFFYVQSILKMGDLPGKFIHLQMQEGSGLVASPSSSEYSGVPTATRSLLVLEHRPQLQQIQTLSSKKKPEEAYKKFAWSVYFLINTK